MTTACWIPMTWGRSGAQPARDIAPMPNGYVTTPVISGRRDYAHRAMYEVAIGPLADGQHIHHRCGNRACANPDHLEPVTQADHMREHHDHLARMHRAKTHCPQGHPYSGDNLYVNPNGRRECRTCRRARRPSSARHSDSIHAQGGMP